MTVFRSFIYLLVGLAMLMGMLLQVGCSTTRNFSATGRVISQAPLSDKTVETTLIFLLSGKKGRISDADWQAFLDDNITPRFENMLLVRDGYTQYWPRDGDFVQGSIKEVILYHDETKTADASIEYIRKRYRHYFKTLPVTRTARYVDISYEETEIEEPIIKKTGEITSKQIKESSGLAFSTRVENLLWTHNDSGDKPRFFAIDLKGNVKGEFALAGARAVDWEDMCSFRMNDTSYLLFADVGDNDFKRKSYTLYLVEEPVVEGDMQPSDPVSFTRTLSFTYEDGPHNCEAVAVDGVAQLVYLISKDWGWRCHVYVLSLQAGAQPVARKMADIGFPLVTAMDMYRDGSRMVVLTYGDAYEYMCKDQDWAKAFKGTPDLIPMPKRKQGESICYGPDPRTFYLTSEKIPAPVWEVIAPASDSNHIMPDGGLAAPSFAP